MTEIIDQIIVVDQKITIDGTDTGTLVGVMITNKFTEKTTIEVNIDKIMDEIIIENKGTGIEVEVGIIIEITTGTIQGKDLSEVEIQVEIRVEKDKHNHGLEWNQKIEDIVINQEQSLDLDQIPELAQIEIGLGVISVESVIILLGNVSILSQIKIQIMVI